MIAKRNWAGIFWLASALLGIAAVPPSVARAATFVIINNDAPGQGLNDPAPATPVGGNTGTSLGAQRLIAFQYAANLWGTRLSSSVTIQVGATFTPLACSDTSAVLGSAGPYTSTNCAGRRIRPGGHHRNGPALRADCVRLSSNMPPRGSSNAFSNALTFAFCPTAVPFSSHEDHYHAHMDMSTCGEGPNRPSLARFIPCLIVDF